jgi:hypothetical protein
LNSHSADLRLRRDVRAAKTVIRIHVVGADQPQCNVPGQIDVQTTAEHEAQFVDVVESLGRKAMVSYQCFQKRRNAMAAKCNFRAKRNVGEHGVVNCLLHSMFTAAAVGAAIESQSKPTIEIVGDAAAKAARICFKRVTHGQQRSGKLAMNNRAGIEDGISAIEFPLGSRLILRGGGRAKHAEANDHRRQDRQKAAEMIS